MFSVTITFVKGYYFASAVARSFLTDVFFHMVCFGIIGPYTKKIFQLSVAGSVLNFLQMPQFNHQAEVVRGVCEEQCSTMLSSFFKELREKKKILKEKALAESSDADNNQGFINH